MITPTVGRVVWFHPSVAAYPDAPPLAALVAYVHNPAMLNIAYFDADGVAHSATSVPLIQDGDERPGAFYCEWMPYQKGQAAASSATKVTDEMVSRFLAWKLPADFAPDGGIAFEPPQHWPIGTNLLNAIQARTMLEHILQ